MEKTCSAHRGPRSPLLRHGDGRARDEDPGEQLASPPQRESRIRRKVGCLHLEACRVGCWREGRDFRHPPPICTPPSFLTPALAPLLGQSPSELCPHNLRSGSQDTCGGRHGPASGGQRPAAKGAEGANSWGRPVARGAGGDDWSPGLSKLRVARFADICRRPSWDTLVRGVGPAMPAPKEPTSRGTCAPFKRPHAGWGREAGSSVPRTGPSSRLHPSAFLICTVSGAHRGSEPGAGGPPSLSAAPPLGGDARVRLAGGGPGGARVPGRCSLSHHPQQKQV